MSEESKLHEKTAVEYKAGEYKSPYAALADQLYRERVLRARQESAEDKFFAGQQLFESACEITLAGMRNQFPGLSEERYCEMLRERLAMRRRRQARDH